MWSLFVVPALAEPHWNRLYSESAEATSFLKSNWNKYTENYHPAYALDDNPATAWVEGVDGDGVGEVLSWDVSALSSARSVKLRIRDGYQKSDVLLAANSAPTAVKIRVWKGRELVREQAATLAPTLGVQDVVVDTGGKGFDHLELEIVAVRPGSKYRDTCVSDIETWVDSDVAYNDAFEQSKRAALGRWITERLATAKFYAALPPTYPFAGAQFRDVQQGGECPAGSLETAVAPIRATAAALAASPAYFSAVIGPSAARIAPDGLYDLPDFLVPLLRAGDVTFFEAKAEAGPHQNLPDDGVERWWTNYRLARTDGVVRAASFGLHEVVQGRGTSDDKSTITLAYDPKGQLTEVLRQAHESDDDGFARDVTSLFRLHWTEGGQVDEITKVVQYDPPRCYQSDWKVQ